MTPDSSAITSVYIHRRFVVRFLIFVLIVLSVLSFVTIAMGWGKDTNLGTVDSGTPTVLADTSPFYVLLIGSDNLEGTALYSGDVNGGATDDEVEQHADTIMLARVDPGSFVITLVTVPANTVLYDSDEPIRDSLLEGGPIQTVYTVERIAGVDIRYYFMLDFSGFENLVNQEGGVLADVPVSIQMQDPVTAKTVRIKAGKDKKLNGAEALAFIRAWEPYHSDVDAHRQKNARDIEENLITHVLDLDDSTVRKVLGAFEKDCITDIDKGELISLVTRFYENKDAVTIYKCTGPYLATTVGPTGEPIIRQPIQAWRELMTVVDSGQDPSEVIPSSNFDPDADPTAPAPSDTGSSKAASAASAPSGDGGSQ